MDHTPWAGPADRVRWQILLDDRGRVTVLTGTARQADVDVGDVADVRLMPGGLGLPMLEVQQRLTLELDAAEEIRLEVFPDLAAAAHAATQAWAGCQPAGDTGQQREGHRR
jgi:hypothetical protein